MITETKDKSLTLMHPKHNELYHSSSGAKFEAKSLYIEGSKIETFMNNNSFVNILDIGLGLGYNACTSIELSYKKNHKINLLSLENDCDLFQEFRTGKARWMKNWSQNWKQYVQKLSLIHI